MSVSLSQVDQNVPNDVGSVQLVPITGALLASSYGLSASLAGSGSNVSLPIIANGYKNFAFATNSSQNGTISIQRYLDQAGTIAQGAALTGSLTAGAYQVVNNANDNKPFQSIIITVTNSAGSAATLTGSLLLFQAN